MKIALFFPCDCLMAVFLSGVIIASFIFLYLEVAFMTILQAQREYLEYGLGCIPVEPCEFYRDIFGYGNIEPTADTDENGVPIYDNEEHMYTPIFIERKQLEDKVYGIRHYFTDDNIEDKIETLTKSDNFIFGSPISYAGRKRDAKGARHMYALCVEIDDLKHSDKKHRLFPDGLRFLYKHFDGLFRREKGQLIQDIPKAFLFPCPTYLVLSGTGIHLYYVFETPLNLFPNVATSLENFKNELTERLWNKCVTYSYNRDKVQFESIYQGFRLVGGVTKNGERTVCYRIGKKVSVDYLNSFRYENCIITSYKLDNDRLTLNEAKTLYPDWYQTRIVEKRPKKTWTCDRKVYEWWRDKQLPKVAVGHRYYCLLILCIYALKCDVPREDLERDCYALIPYLDNLTEKEDNHFTEQDVKAALKAYENPRNKTYPIKSIQYKSGIDFPRNQRNGRTRAQHVKIMNFMRDEIHHKTNWREGNGRPSAELIVLEWQQQHPHGRKADCIRDTGLTKPTVYKWWQG